MLRLLSDENFNGDVIRGLLRRRPTIDCIRAQDTGLCGMDDPPLLAWAAKNNRIILTHDRATMPEYAYERLKKVAAMPGLFVFNDRFPVNRTIEELLLLDTCSEQAEWNGLVVYLPL